MDPKELVDTTPIEQLIEKLSASSVFGEPTKEDDTVIIPVAQVAYGFGYGGGFSEGQTKVGKASNAGEEARDADANSGSAGGEGGGSGGGAGGRATPRGYIRITPEGVNYEPIEDSMIVPLAGIAMAAWSIFWIAATVRHIAKFVAKTRQAAIRKG